FDSSRGKPVSFKLNQVVPVGQKVYNLLKKVEKSNSFSHQNWRMGSKGLDRFHQMRRYTFDVEVIDVKADT
ncbi:SlyD, partial [Pasteurella multocida subsp. multocida str. Anand1_cattle]